MRNSLSIERIVTFEETQLRKHNSTNKIIQKIIIFTILLIYAILLMTPFYVILTTSFKSYEDVYSSLGFVWFPEEISVQAYIDVLVNDPFRDIVGMPSLLSGFINTLWSTLIPTIIGLFTSGLAAYAYAKMKFKGRENIFLIELITMMIPAGTMAIPTYLFYDALGWTDSYLPLIIPGLFGGATTIFFLRSYMMSIPDEIIEAAKIDGLNSFEIYLKIISPQTIPAFIAQFIFGFVGGYNNYMGPLLYLPNPEQYTLQLVVSEFQIMFADGNQLCAMALLAMTPLIILYIVFQKFFIEGISIGGGKE